MSAQSGVLYIATSSPSFEMRLDDVVSVYPSPSSLRRGAHLLTLALERAYPPTANTRSST
jgi:hypothetical protein